MDDHAAEAIGLVGVSLGYGSKKVVTGLNASVPGNGITALLGQNGCGKTTLLRALIKNIRPIEGTIYLRGEDLGGIGIEALPMHLSYAPAALEDMVGIRVIDLVSNARKAGRWLRQSEAMLALSSVGMGSLSDSLFNELSTGQKKLALIARSIAIDAPIALLDEPTSGLDPTNKQIIRSVISGLSVQKSSVIIATHDLDLALRSDYVIALKNGTLFKSGPASDVLTSRNLTLLYGSRISVRRIGGRKLAVYDG